MYLIFCLGFIFIFGKWYCHVHMITLGVNGLIAWLICNFKNVMQKLILILLWSFCKDIGDCCQCLCNGDWQTIFIFSSKNTTTLDNIDKVICLYYLAKMIEGLEKVKHCCKKEIMDLSIWWTKNWDLTQNLGFDPIFGIWPKFWDLKPLGQGIGKRGYP